MADFIEVYDDALPRELCQQIINDFEGSEQITRGTTGNGVDLERKKSWDINISLHPDWQAMQAQILKHAYPCIKQYLQRYYFTLVGALAPSIIDPATGQPKALSQDNFSQLGLAHLDKIIPALYRYGTINVQKYEKRNGGYPHWHSEIYPRAQDCDELHRVLLFMFYLNDVSKGGETEFFYQKKKVKPKAGRMVIAPAGFTHTHRGNMPESNDKYIVTSWILYHRAEQMYGQPQGQNQHSGRQPTPPN